jgi:hypothetical protein
MCCCLYKRTGSRFLKNHLHTADILMNRRGYVMSKSDHEKQQMSRADMKKQAKTSSQNLVMNVLIAIVSVCILALIINIFVLMK